ncbi:nicotinate-nucleotide adenylyltransferase [Oikeobacillus pervagus]|uniref:Probable nicotinate-nucleotide adenylyltransferase n=1 Tax=Oikeobacillus pervagus TaxID=1325931 RepID=A0AAJ1WKN6_9BACI|nr:nicotinate-nucleotide adenylyltransferase [Oikeobacillus pervagus]MDQ0216723.1 nicotinate-nucleotide adenylyltransferase [Oikeobacillus pervagus]
MKKKVGILGGTFNPPHIGHLMIANEVLHALNLDEVRFMPNQEPPHKEIAQGVTNVDRMNMVKLAIQDHGQFYIEPIEMDRGGKSFTFETMKLLKEREPKTEFYFIIGGDMIEYLPKWYKIDKLLDLVTFVGVNRPEFSSITTFPVLLVDIPEIHLSSSLIRERIGKDYTVKYLLPEKVISYIKEKQLYGSKRSAKNR